MKRLLAANREVSVADEKTEPKPLRIDIVSLFPGYFQGPLDSSILGRARNNGLLDVHLVDLRKYGEGSYHQVDDRVYGGGPGMVLMAEPVAQALRDAKASGEGKAHTVFLSPQGAPLTAKRCRALAEHEHLVLLCGHYEGIDQRVLDKEVDEEISIGDYVLTNGCLPAIVLIDAVARFKPGVIGNDDAANEDSFEQELLDCPHYTRPEVFEGEKVPEVLLEGHHEKTAQWRRSQAVTKTQQQRPDLYMRYLALQDSGLEVSGLAAKRDHFGIAKQGASAIRLKVRKLRTSRRFYREQLGLPLESESDTEVMFRLGSQKLILMPGLQEPVVDSPVLLETELTSPKQLQKLLAWAEKEGRGGALPQDGDPTGVPAQAWFHDPDGYLWRVRTV